MPTTSETSDDTSPSRQYLLKKPVHDDCEVMDFKDTASETSFRESIHDSTSNRGNESVASNEFDSDKKVINDEENAAKSDIIKNYVVTLTYQEKLQKQCLSVIENVYFLIFMTILTLWSLFSTDVKYIATGKSADAGFDAVMIFIFLVFMIELLVSCFCKPDYFLWPTWERKPGETLFELWYHRLTIGSFYFWLDLLASLSLLFDITLVTGENYIQTGVAALISTGLRTAARSVKLLRLLRFIRLSKVFKYVFILADHFSHKNTTTRADDKSDEAQKSHVGEKISELTTQRVIVLVIIMLIIIPSLLVYSFQQTDTVAFQMVNNLAIQNATNSSYSQGLIYMKNYIVATTDVVDIQISYNANTPPITLYNDPIMSSLRKSEMLYIQSASTKPYVVTTMYFNERSYVIEDSYYNMLETLFVIIVLLTATYFFSSDVNKLVITPIEYMVALVRKISENPLRVDYKTAGAADGFQEGLETVILLSTITKIGGLMRVGFGEAGASVIAKNLAESSGGHLNLMGTGTLITSIFGFCDVRQFTDTTECLQEEVMLFVNRIAHILHGIVVQCSGQANKNIGDAFLLTWKIDDSIKGTPDESVLADQALLAFVKTLIELIRYETFICNFTPDATSRLYKRFPGYNVRIGCGLHYGWAIEGAIGSNRKIDASYLSPHVNFTEFLESSTKAYGVPMLLSEAFYKRLSPAASRYCRQVDRIKRADDDAPIGLYTYDCDLSIDFSDHNRRRNTIVNNNRRATNSHSNSNVRSNRLSTRIKPGNMLNTDGRSFRYKLATKDSSLSSQPSQGFRKAPEINILPYVPRVWEKDEDVAEIRHKFTPQFKNIWVQAIENYLSGDWDISMQHLKECLRMTKGADGPSKFLLGLIEDAGGKSPADWQGFREEDDGH